MKIIGNSTFHFSINTDVFIIYHALHFVGGGSQNKSMIQILSDVFNVPVFVGDVPDSGALGAAFRAFHGHVCHKAGKYINADEVLTGKVVENFKFDLVAKPNEEHAKLYRELIRRYEELEKMHVRLL
jgi:xylulokinase